MKAVPLTKITAIVLLLASATLSAAEDEAWELRRDRDGIQVFTRSVAGSPFDAVRTVTHMEDVRLASLVALIEDAEACARWADRCAESYLVERISETESLVYSHNDMPFPVRDRDVLARVNWMQDPETFAVEMSSVATEGRMAEVRGRLRLTEAMASWYFRPNADGSVLVSNEAHINPGSALPGWITNILLVDAPFETMKSFINEVRKPEYAEAEVGFIRERPRQ